MRNAGALEGWRILVVEDDFLVAEALRDILQEAGATIIGPIGWLDEALAAVQRDDPRLDAAVLDVNLHDRTSYAVADALVERGIKFVFLTGYDSGSLDAAYRGYPRCEKPFQFQAIIAALTSDSR